MTPKAVLENIIRWADPNLIDVNFEEAVKDIHANSLYSWKRKVDKFTPEALEIMAPILERHGYEPTS